MLPDGSGLWLSTGRYLTPGGSSSTRRGSTPDVAVDGPDVEFGAPPPRRSDLRQGARDAARADRRERTPEKARPLVLTPPDRSRITAQVAAASRIADGLRRLRGGAMNKQELIAKIAKDTAYPKTSAAAARRFGPHGITKSLKKGDSITFVGFGTFKTSQPQGAHRAQPADRRVDQDPEAARRAVHRRQSAEGRGQVAARPLGQRGTGRGSTPGRATPARRRLRPCVLSLPRPLTAAPYSCCYTGRSCKCPVFQTDRRVAQMVRAPA